MSTFHIRSHSGFEDREIQARRKRCVVASRCATKCLSFLRSGRQFLTFDISKEWTSTGKCKRCVPRRGNFSRALLSHRPSSPKKKFRRPFDMRDLYIAQATTRVASRLDLTHEEHAPPLRRSQLCPPSVKMGKKKDGPILTSNTSSVANPKSSSTTYTAGNSSILKSSFAPSRYQLSLFASIIQGLDSQHLRIHHTSGDLRGDHALASRANITCLDWGYYGQHHGEHSQQDPSRKRKRSGQVNGNGPGRHGKDVVVAFGTSESQIQFYSPSEAKIVGELKNGHSNGINDFKFVRDGANDEAWSCGGDRLLIQWNLRKGRISR